MARLVMERIGRGSPILFVHGSLGDLHSFARQAEYFKSGHQVISYSRRCYPPNAALKNSDHCTMENEATDLLELLRDEIREPAHVVAASYGAYVALFAAARDPSMVRSLVACEPPLLRILRGTGQGEKSFDWFAKSVLEPSHAAFANGNDEEGVAVFVSGILGGPGLFYQMPEPARNEMLRFKDSLRAEINSEFDLFMPEISDRELNGIRIPVLFVEGEKSPPMFHLITDELRSRIPDSRSVVIPLSGHAMYITNPAAFNVSIGKFLQSAEIQ